MIECMDDNPYQSPKSVPKLEKRPLKPPNRYSNALCYGLIAFWGVLGAEMATVQIALTPDWSKPLLYGWFAACAFPVGLAIAFWAWRNPKSKRPALAAMLLAVCPFVLFYAFLILGQG